MPYSSDEGKAWMGERIVADAPASVLDVGAGWGTYAHLLPPPPNNKINKRSVEAPDPTTTPVNRRG